MRRHWPIRPIDGAVARLLLEQLIGEVVIPLWSVGTVWWDIRDANYCFDEATGRLTMIDIDSLAAYTDEIIRTPNVWTARDKGRPAALARLRQMTLRILLAQGPVAKATVRRNLYDAWDNELGPALQALGHATDLDGCSAMQRFFDRLETIGLLR